MEDFTKEQLEAILQERRFEDLKGEYETVWLECKVQHYDLQYGYQKAELAKDISSFANSDGGYLLIGVDAPNRNTEATASPAVTEDKSHVPMERAGDKIISIPLISKVSASVNLEQIGKILDEWIHPEIAGLDTYFAPSVDNPEKGLLIIKVPEQKESDKPFLYYDATRERPKKSDNILFGHARRIRANSKRRSIEEIYETLQKGSHQPSQLASAIAETVKTAIDEALASPATKKGFETIRKENEARVKKNLLEREIPEDRVLSLSGFTGSANNLSTFKNIDAIRDLVDYYTKGLRKDGWKLLYSAEIQEQSPDSIRTKWKDVRGITLFADGSVVFACDINYICFLSGEFFDKPPNIIPIALVELVLQFVDFYLRYLSLLELETQEVFVGIDGFNLNKNERKTTLAPREAMPNQHVIPRQANQNNYSALIEIDGRDATYVAFDVIEKIYQLFELSAEQIPYTQVDDNGRRQIDMTQFVREEA